MSEVVIPGAVAKDVFSRLSWFAAGALVLAIEGEALSEFACVPMAGSTLQCSAEEFTIVSLSGEVMRCVQGIWSLLV